MAAAEHDNWALVEVDFRITFPFKEVDTSVWLVTAFLTQTTWTVFSAKTRALVTAIEDFGASLIARKSITRCCARH
jgi:hypothetical protein